MRKVVINTLICLVCTAIIFYLHFAVYDGMLLQEPFFIGSICAVCIVFALRSNIDDQTYTTNGTTRQPFCGYGCISSYGVRLQSAYRLFSSPNRTTLNTGLH